MKNKELYHFICAITPETPVEVLRSADGSVEHYEFTSAGMASTESFSIMAFIGTAQEIVTAISIVCRTEQGMMNFSTSDPEAVERLVNWVLHP